MPNIQGVLKERADKLAFLGVPNEDGTTKTYRRMQGFTALSQTKNPRSYERQYVDELQAQTDVVGYSPSMPFNFDYYVGNMVHDYVAEIIDNEMVGTAAVVEILLYDGTKDPETENNAQLRRWAVIADNEGTVLDAYTYSGNLTVKGPVTWGKATLQAEGEEEDMIAVWGTSEEVTP